MSKKYNIILFAKIILFGIIIWGTSCSSQKNITSNNKNNIEFYKVNISNKKLENELKSWIGTPYKYGGQSKKGVDCSGLIIQIYQKVYDKKLYRASYEIYEKNCKKINKRQLKEGDLLFFITSKKGKRINHVGLYLNNNKFIHSTVQRGVIISDLTEEYYKKRYVEAGRVKD